MQKLTEKVHSEKEKPEIVWIKREDSQETKTTKKLTKTETETNAAAKQVQVPIVYSKQYGVHFAKLEKLHPFDAEKGKNIAKV